MFLVTFGWAYIIGRLDNFNITGLFLVTFGWAYIIGRLDNLNITGIVWLTYVDGLISSGVKGGTRGSAR